MHRRSRNTLFSTIPLRIAGTLLIIVGAWGSRVQAQNTRDRDFTTQEWLEDLGYAVDVLKDHHPNLYYRTTEKAFEAAVETARKEIRSAATDVQAYMAIRRLFATVQDGHTQLLDQGAWDLTDLRFPFRLDRFSDGIFITVVDREHQNLLGARVTKIDGVPVESVFDRVEDVTNVDNTFGRIRPTLSTMTFARLIHGLGVTTELDRMQMEVVAPTGETTNVLFEARHDTSPILWSNRVNLGPLPGAFVSPATVLGDATPLHLRRQGPEVSFYWFEPLPKARAVYVQFNQIGNDPESDETLGEFTDRFWHFVDAQGVGVQRVIVDLRYNDGGVARRIIPFVNEIIKRDRFRNVGGLFVLTGNRTYSAAVIFLTELVVHTGVVVVGTPPGAPFNFFSDAEIRGHLPNSGFGILVASRQVDNSWSDDTVFYPPDVDAPFSSRDYFSGRDPALEAALDWRVPECP